MLQEISTLFTLIVHSWCGGVNGSVGKCRMMWVWERIGECEYVGKCKYLWTEVSGRTERASAEGGGGCCVMWNLLSVSQSHCCSIPPTLVLVLTPEFILNPSLATGTPKDLEGGWLGTGLTWPAPRENEPEQVQVRFRKVSPGVGIIHRSIP